MKRLVKTALLPAALGLMLSALPAHASGLGAYATIATGNFDFQADINGGGTDDVDGSQTALGLGLVFDSNCAKSSLINYRLNAGYESVNLNPKDSSEDESFGYVGLDNTLGFGIYTNEQMRLWLGPQIRVGYAWGSGDGMTDESSAIVYGLGAALGLNYHLGMDYDVSFVAGMRNDWYNGDFTAGDGTKGDFDGSATYGYFNVSLLWRSLDDKFGAQ